MKKMALTLYRGLSSSEFNAASEALLRENRQTWRQIIERRTKGKFDYPETLNKDIAKLHRNLRLERQYFTDSKVIAETYAKKVGGLIVEMIVPVNDIVNHFDIEFQNFGRRKKQFEIVYCVKGSLLNRFSRRWRLKVRRMK